MPAGSDPRERMWKLSRQVPSGGMVGQLDDPPRVVERVDVAPPRERLVGDPNAVLGGALGQRAQLLGGERVVVDRGGARRSSRRAECPRRAPP